MVEAAVCAASVTAPTASALTSTPGRTRQGGNSCYWERLSGFGGDLNDIIANDHP
jgi:hypothetical protein